MVGENGDFMITDFGVSTHVKSTLRKSMSAAFSSAGTIAYMAPERFSKDNTPIMANDIYSLGATVYEMLTGDTPFGDDGGLIQMKGAEVPELKGDFSPQLKEVIARCLRTNPWERPTAEQLEEYAEAGLEGKKIKFVGDKSFWEKYKVFIIAAAAIVIVGIVIGTITASKTREAEREELLAQQTMAYNDSIEALAKTYIITGDSLVNIGDAHDEGYEKAYIKAYQIYTQASECKLKDGSSIKWKDDANKKLDKVGQNLYSAFVSLNEKADIFSDDEEIAGEFKNRAKSISEIIDVAKYQTKDNKENQ